jgi:hypothetical protein
MIFLDRGFLRLNGKVAHASYRNTTRTATTAAFNCEPFQAFALGRYDEEVLHVAFPQSSFVYVNVIVTVPSGPVVVLSSVFSNLHLFGDIIISSKP